MNLPFVTVDMHQIWSFNQKRHNWTSLQEETENGIEKWCGTTLHSVATWKLMLGKSRFARLFNRSKVKMSYICMPYVETVIKSHNTTVLNPQPQDQVAGCNCRNPASCPLRGNCLATGLIYSANVTTETLDKIYYGSTKGRFKKRYDKHNYDFRHRAQRKATELSKLIWDLGCKHWIHYHMGHCYKSTTLRRRIQKMRSVSIWETGHRTIHPSGNDKLSFGNRFEVQAYE